MEYTSCGHGRKVVVLLRLSLVVERSGINERIDVKESAERGYGVAGPKRDRERERLRHFRVSHGIVLICLAIDRDVHMLHHHEWLI